MHDQNTPLDLTVIQNQLTNITDLCRDWRSLFLFILRLKVLGLDVTKLSPNVMLHKTFLDAPLVHQ